MRREAGGPRKARSGTAGDRSTGFALAEVLAALVVAAVGSLAAAAGFVAAWRAEHAAAASQRALALAADAGERLRAVGAVARGVEANHWQLEARALLGALPGPQPVEETLAEAARFAPVEGSAPQWQVTLRWNDRVAAGAHRLVAPLGVSAAP